VSVEVPLNTSFKYFPYVTMGGAVSICVRRTAAARDHTPVFFLPLLCSSLLTRFIPFFFSSKAHRPTTFLAIYFKANFLATLTARPVGCSASYTTPSDVYKPNNDLARQSHFNIHSFSIRNSSPFLSWFNNDKCAVFTLFICYFLATCNAIGP
jgi:hypothetical protein